MDKLWKIIKHEYTRHVLRKRFIIALLSVPIWILFSFGLAMISILLQFNRAPVGYVDQSGLITTQPLQNDAPSFSRVKFLPYPTEPEARAALQAQKIQAYFVLPASYRQTFDSRLVYLKKPNASIYQQFRSLLRTNLLAGKSAIITQRVTNEPVLDIHATSEQRQANNTDWFKTFAPIAAGVFLLTAIFTSSGYLMQSVAEEKENRTMEILATSASPGEIMSGKTIALISVGLTQVLVWSLFPLAAIALLRAYTPFLQSVSVDWKLVGLIFATILPTFVLISAMMAAIGATVTEAREGQQVSSLVSLLVMSPMMLMMVILGNPSGIFSVALSFFPLTAALTMLLRMAFATVPNWQILLSAGILILSAVGALWLAGRVFRVGMLRYGKRLGWKDVFQAIKPRRDGSSTRQEAGANE